jgi:N-acylneuraminate cytidylyltransferase
MRPFCGKPMIARSIEAVVVSTDDEEIAAVAESCGAQAPFRRPPELSNDHATTLPVIAHTIRWWE